MRLNFEKLIQFITFVQNSSLMELHETAAKEQEVVVSDYELERGKPIPNTGIRVSVEKVFEDLA
ncbi:MAG: hypothetical protein EPGJADBJ_02238 [Saprospiraceae bacterium]|nr:hypothetical protein [Saprospiraceae bacterium]